MTNKVSNTSKLDFFGSRGDIYTAVSVSTPTLLLEEPIAKTPTFEDFEFHHTFGYNSNKLDTGNLKLKEVLSTIEEQLAAGREHVTISIVSSASHVPTKTFKTNDRLAQARA